MAAVQKPFQNPLLPFLAGGRRIILDGGLATELERRGYNLDDPLWSARLLLEEPERIRAVHRDYLAAGADVIIAASYQASFQGIMESRGLTHAAAGQVLQSAVNLALAERDAYWASLSSTEREGRQRPLVAASIGPYGAYLANGSEYTGDYALDVGGLLAFHQERWHLLARSGADLLACETTPSYPEALAYAHLLRETPHTPAWISFTARDAAHISDGTPLERCAALFEQLPNVVALGINCTPPSLIPGLLARLRVATQKPLLVYPNSGEHYNVAQRRWEGEADPQDFAAQASDWRIAGAQLIGGCCRTTPEHIRRLANTDFSKQSL